MGNNKYCIIMAGGIGSRFWPISRNARPKQFLDILGTGKTFLRSTFERFRPIVPVENFLVVTNAAYKELVLEQIPELGQGQVMCEPIGRNTAPCIAYAAFRLNAMSPDSTMIVTPSDHLILDPVQFGEIITKSADYISGADAMMTIGIKPKSPNTGYGYIQIEKSGVHAGEINKVKTFTEKPDAEMARAFIESGEFLWNSGIFIWDTKTYLAAMKEFLPDIYQLFDSVNPLYGTPQEYGRIEEIYPESRAVSVDIGIMEKARNVYVCCGDFGWSDVGTWSSLYEHSQKDENGNVAPAGSSLYNTRGCIVKIADDKLSVIDGLENYIVVESGGVLMICPRDGEQNIKRYLEDVKFSGNDKFI